MECERKQDVQAYHDGEMPSQRVSEFEKHLQACAACLAELEVLRRLSRFVEEMEIPAIGALAMERMKQRVKAVAERGVLRLAEWLTAAAAAVLVAAMIGMPREQSAANPPQHATQLEQAAWQQVALGQPADQQEMTSVDPIADLMQVEPSQNK